MKQIFFSLSIALATITNLIGQCGFDNHAITTSTNSIVCKGDVTIGLASTSQYMLYILVADGDTIDYAWHDEGNFGPLSFDPVLIQETTEFEVVAQNNIYPNSIGFNPWGVNYAQNPMNSINNVFTIQAWVLGFGQMPNQYYPIASFQGNTPSFGILNGELVFRIGSTQILASFGTIVPEGDWHHVAVSYNGNTGECRLFLDGVQVAFNITGPQTFSNTVLRIGGDFNSTVNSFNGNIDNLAIFNTELSGSQIWDYAETCLDNSVPNLTALYKMNENQGLITLDEVTNTYASIFSLNNNYDYVWSGGYWQVCSYPCYQTMSLPITVAVTDVPNETFTASNTFFCEPGESVDIESANSHDGASYFLIHSTTGDTLSGPVLGTGGALTLNSGDLTETTTLHVEGTMIYPSSGVYLANAGLLPDADFEYTDFTMEAWFKNDTSYNYTSDPDILLAFSFDQNTEAPTDAISIRADINTGQVYLVGHNFFSALPQPNPSSNGTTTIMDGEWYHLALSFSETDGNYRLLINGSEELVYATPFNNYPWMGGLVLIDVEYLEQEMEPIPSARGTFDEIRFWSEARTAAQVSSMMNGCIEADQPYLEGYWRVDEMQGPVLNDIAGSIGNLYLGGPGANNPIEGVNYVWTTGIFECALCGAVVSDPITITIGDTDAPTVTCQNLTKSLDVNGVASIIPSELNVVVNDNCDTAPSITLSQSTFTCADATAPFSVLVTATDASGNAGTCSSQITIVDNISPTITNLPENIQVSVNNTGCSATVTWDLPSFADNCSVATINASHQPGDVFEVGSTQVSYTILDDAGNSTSASFNVIVNNNMSVNVNTVQVACFGGENGEITASASGGTSPYNYSWDNGSNTANISGLEAGQYELTVTDANSCEVTTTVNVLEPQALEISNVVLTNPSSCGTNTGLISLNIFGGTGAYTFEWSNNTNAQNLLNVAAGTYDLLVTDANGCEAEGSWSLSDPNAPSVTLNAANSNLTLNCSYDENGAISINVELYGGAQTATFNWNNGAYSTQNIADLTPGQYSVLVTDQNNCSAQFNAAITAPEEFIISGFTANDLNCFNDATGSISITVNGGTPEYSYNWNNETYATQNIQNLGAGTYSVLIIDANGCETNGSYDLTQPTQILISHDATDIYSGNDGAINITVTGGTGEYTYSWSGPNNFTSSDANISGLSTAGTYTLTIQDENDCEAEISVEVASFVNIVSHELENISMYPNPSTGVFNISTPLAEGLIIVTDASGRKIMEVLINANLTSVDIEKSEAGVYFFEIHQAGKITILRGVLN